MFHQWSNSNRIVKMSKFLRFILPVFLLVGFSQAKAAYLVFVPVDIVQPDGIVLHVFATGDEFFYRIHDQENYTITRNANTGYFVYATLLDGELMPTDLIVGQSNPSLSDIQPGITISSEKQDALRKAFLQQTPKRPSLDMTSTTPLTTGTFNNLVVYIRFSDQAEFTTPADDYNAMFNSSVSGANSMVNYFREASFNALTINSGFYPVSSGPAIISYQDSHCSLYYSPYDSATNPDGYHPSERTDREHSLLANAVNFISSSVPAGLTIDHNGDGYVDNVCFIVRGGTTAWSTLLWPHSWSLYSQTVYIQGKRVWDYTFQLDEFLSSYGNGVLCHEMFHTLGAPDLYHYSGDGMTPVDSWDIMANTTNPPQSMGAFMKYKYGNWISGIPQIMASGVYTLNPVTSSVNNCYKLFSNSSSTEYFVFEYRKKTGTFENSVPASGMLIYRINSTAGSGNMNGPPDEVYIYRPGGTQTLNGIINQAMFSSETGHTQFNNGTNPNCFFSDGSLANITVHSVGAALNTISFHVDIGTVANFSASSTLTKTNIPVQFTDLSSGGPTSWIWTIMPATHSFVSGTNASTQHPVVKFNSPGIYSVTLLVNGPGGPNVAVKHNYITVTLNAFLGNDTIIPAGDTLNLSPGSGFATYQWNTGATTPLIRVSETGLYSVTVTDNNGNQGSDEINVSVAFGSLEGTLRYLNTAAEPLGNVPINLMQGNTLIKTTITNDTGFYYFDKIIPGNYAIQINPAIPWGGVNSTDALIALKHFVGMGVLSGLKKTAGDVNLSGQVNSLDAFYIQKRFMNQINSFPAPDWIFENPPFTVSAFATETHDIHCLCAGDVNASYTLPSAKNRKRLNKTL